MDSWRLKRYNITMRKCFIYIVMMMVVGCYALPSQAAAIIKNMNISTKGEVIHLKLDISKVTTHKVFTLANPNRVVIDVTQALWQANSTMLGKDKRIKEVRHGIRNGTDVRIVLETTQQMKIIANQRSSKQLNLSIVSASYAPSTKPSVAQSNKATQSNKKVPQSMQKGYDSKLAFTLPEFRPFKVKRYTRSVTQPLQTMFPPRKPVLGTGKLVAETHYYKPLVVIDAGHGGVDPGAIGKAGTREKDVTLQYARELKRILDESGVYRVALTRYKDEYVNLGKRVEKARRADGDILISLHADSHKNRHTRGLSVYTISEDRAVREARKLKLNASRKDIIRGVDLSDESKDVQHLLIDMVKRDTKNTSNSFADILVNALGDEAKLLRRPHRNASLAVLTGIDIPSVLIELGYLSNSEEERLLKTQRYRTKLTYGIVKAIDAYFRKFPPQR